MNTDLSHSLPQELLLDQLTIPSTHRFLLSPEEMIFVLEEGQVDLYSLSFAGKRPELTEIMQQVASQFLSFPSHFFPGTLHFLASFKTGDWLFPFSLNFPDLPYCILAVARGNCQVSRLSLSKLRQHLPQSSTLQALTLVQMQKWIKRLNIVDHGFSQSAFPLSLNAYERYTLDLGAIFMNSRFKEKGGEQDVFWLKVHKGSIGCWGLPSLTIDNKSGLYPFSSLEWFKCLQPATVELFPSHPEFLVDKRLWIGFSLFQKHFLRLLTILQAEQQAKSKQESQIRTQRDHLLLDQSIEEMQMLLNPQPPKIMGPEQDALYQACQQVGNYLGLKFTWQKEVAANNVEERLRALCMNSQIYFRRIRLFDRWWQSKAMPLVAFHQDDHQPIALLPHPSLNYQMINPTKNEKIAVTDEVAREVSTIAYMFYRQLPPGHLTLRHIGRFGFWKRGRDWAAFLFLVLCSTLASLSIPIITQFLFDVVIPNRNVFLLFEIALGAVLITLSTLAFNYGRESIILRLESLNDHDLEMAIWQRLINLPVRFFRRYSIYELFTFTSAISSIRQLLTSHVIQVLLNGAFAVLYFFLMFYYSGILATVGLVLIIIKILSVMFPVFFGIQYGRQALDRQIQANNKMLEMVQALTKVRLAGAEARMFHRWQQSYAQLQQLNLKILFLGLKSGVFNSFLGTTSTLVIYFVVILIVTAQPAGISSVGLTIGQFMAFMSIFGLFSSALQQVGSTLLSVIGIIPLWEKAKSFTETSIEEMANRADPGILQGEVRMDHLTFSYLPDRPPVLHDISLHIRPGECIGIVGPSGEGKTTLVRLLLGFEQSDQGSIYYDNKDLKGLNLQAVRRQLGVVLQSGAIFDGTILDNINSGRHYSVEEVKEALFLSGASAFVQDLSMGIHTVLTNGGLSLSGGQRQLILLARAIVGKPKILILDEATSALDNERQKIVHDHLNRLPMTRIIVAQRLNAVQHTDRIYVIDKGRIADQGTFAELAARPGFFSELLAKQSST